MDRRDTELTAVEVVGTVLGHPVTVDAGRNRDADWDSLKHIQIVFAIEEKFAIQLSEQEMGECDTIQKLVDAVRAHHET